MTEQSSGYAEASALMRPGWLGKVARCLLRRRTMLLVLLPVLVLFAAQPRPGWYMAGVVLALAGQALRFWAAGHIVKAKQLTQTGPYAYVRNPLYLGSLLITAGWGAMSGRASLAAVLLGVFAITHGLAIWSEERYLRERFASGFEDYCRRVPRILPRLTAPPGSRGQFSWQQALHCDGEGMNAVCVGLLALAYGTRLWW